MDSQRRQLTPDLEFAAHAINNAMDDCAVFPDHFFDLKNRRGYVAGARQQAALVIREGTGYTYAEIAEFIGYQSSALAPANAARKFLTPEKIREKIEHINSPSDSEASDSPTDEIIEYDELTTLFGDGLRGAYPEILAAGEKLLEEQATASAWYEIRARRLAPFVHEPGFADAQQALQGTCDAFEYRDEPLSEHVLLKKKERELRRLRHTAGWMIDVISPSLPDRAKASIMNYQTLPGYYAGVHRMWKLIESVFERPDDPAPFPAEAVERVDRILVAARMDRDHFWRMAKERAENLPERYRRWPRGF